MDYTKYSEIIKSCTKCPLSQTRKNVVVGEGNPDADIMIVGEAPGEEEDLTGRPFVGISGKLLRQFLKKVGFNIMDDLYITNIVKCRPPKNRDPEENELNKCGFYLIEQIKTYIKPKVIVGIGRISSNVMMPGFKLKDDHGIIFNMGDYQFMGTYHPAGALRKKEFKEKLYDDLKTLYNTFYSNRKKRMDEFFE